MKRGLSLAAVLVVLLFVGECAAQGGGRLSPSQCDNEKRLLVSRCRPIILGNKPSAACCARIRLTHFECVCPVVTPKLAALIGVQRVLNILRGCGRTVPRHFVCGAITTP
ncbi:uncharacterized protein LOC110820485 [Carica papaya]|uniref:uncharacterized protein LOC110820485 n=1 Tax=Carica papaya TaxID=3649 RepID=UPI000B8D002E|nr:uncharacterized protein LOC110820485 [Carica papaya]